MHCENFCNINGIQIKLFQNLIDLNLSSNNIEDIGELQVLQKVQTLNLSCNKITQIKGLESMISSLSKLILSHNRITSLQYFKQII
jgi:Leucine-rich repeat (LRR) protein